MKRPAVVFCGRFQPVGFCGRDGTSMITKLSNGWERPPGADLALRPVSLIT